MTLKIRVKADSILCFLTFEILIMKTINAALLSGILLLAVSACETQRTQKCNVNLELYPVIHAQKPEIRSPCISKNGDELVLIQTKEKRFALVPVTVENGDPRDYISGHWGKGNQMDPGCDDFPNLTRTGLHSEKELLETTTITNKPVDEISEEARPGRSSFEGFIAEDEDIISVLVSDNQLVHRLGFSHPELAKPLFHIFNLILEHRKHFVGRARIFDDVQYLGYNQHKINVKWGGDKGFQTSIFNDGNLGYYWIKIQRKLTDKELSFLKKQYSYLNEDQFQLMVEKISGFNTGEMVPYYIMNYGFYEGHTGYRADPIAITLIFGLRTLPEIDKTLKHKLPQFLRI